MKLISSLSQGDSGSGAHLCGLLLTSNLTHIVCDFQFNLSYPEHGLSWWTSKECQWWWLWHLWSRMEQHWWATNNGRSPSRWWHHGHRYGLWRRYYPPPPPPLYQPSPAQPELRGAATTRQCDHTAPPLLLAPAAFTFLHIPRQFVVLFE